MAKMHAAELLAYGHGRKAD